MSAFWRYWIFQSPGWVLLIAAVYLAHLWVGLSLTGAFVVFGLWLLKDLIFFPLLVDHYQVREGVPHISLVGRKAVSREPLAPSGYVELEGQLWQARPVSDDTMGEASGPIAAGETVEVRGVDGLTLLVRRA